jgi:hypothetical protein
MNNPFKIGDKVVRLNWDHGNFKVGDVGEVIKVSSDLRVALRSDAPQFAHRIENLRAAIAGQDYGVPAPDYENFNAVLGPNTGHLPDGSSVQKHSAGLLYPCVLILRDKRLHGEGKYDVGVISPRNPEPIWCSSTDAAVAVAVAIKADLQGA